MNIRDLVIGGVAGAALAVIATHYFSGASASPVAAPAAASTSAPLAPALVPQPTSAPAAAVAASQVASASSHGGAPVAVTPAAACPPVLAAADPRKTGASAVAPAALRVDVPAVALSSEHAKLLLDMSDRPPSLQELHARFAGEPLDPDWSRQMETQLRQSLQDAGVQKGLELLAVECRRTLCELRLFGVGAGAAQRWGGTVGQIAQQPWWGPNFSGISSSTTGPDDRSVIATILHRAKR